MEDSGGTVPTHWASTSLSILTFGRKKGSVARHLLPANGSPPRAATIGRFRLGHASSVCHRRGCRLHSVVAHPVADETKRGQPLFGCQSVTRDAVVGEDEGRRAIQQPRRKDERAIHEYRHQREEATAIQCVAAVRSIMVPRSLKTFVSKPLPIAAINHLKIPAVDSVRLSIVYLYCYFFLTLLLGVSFMPWITI